MDWLRRWCGVALPVLVGQVSLLLVISVQTQQSVSNNSEPFYE